jgi:hypothetical protein
VDLGTDEIEHELYLRSPTTPWIERSISRSRSRRDEQEVADNAGHNSKIGVVAGDGMLAVWWWTC